MMAGADIGRKIGIRVNTPVNFTKGARWDNGNCIVWRIMMFECMLAFVGGMMFGAVGFLFIIALLVGGNPRHWRK